MDELGTPQSGPGGTLRADTPARVSPLPGEAPLAMPAQSLREGCARACVSTAPPLIGLRRAAVIGGAAAMTAAAGCQMYLVLAVNGITVLGAAMVLLFVLLFGWIALACTSALAGFATLLAGARTTVAPVPTTRTALLLPTYNEDPARIATAIAAMAEDLAEQGAGDDFDFFILSDTTNPDVWVGEEASFLALRERGLHQVYYRHRPQNTARKAGNVADWVTRFGAAYPQFLILDADSLMSARLLLRLVATMERNPGIGLVQTLPIIVGASTPFARLQQFAARVYGPVIANGLAFWHGAEGNYWGHNAMIRTRAFADCAGLPKLSGRGPFGGHILSHDFVEAALLRRGGWAVHMEPRLGGSYEEGPPSLVDAAIRDRRWCQGNLQHAAVLPARGLHWVSRTHLLTGIGSYVTAPLWLLFLLVGLLIALQAHFEPFDYFPGGRSLFPRWPIVDPVRARFLFEGAMGVLLLPKLLGLVATLLQGAARRGCGRGARLVAGVLVEVLLSGLVAPIAMLTQTADVVSVLRGRDSGWQPQRRGDGVVPWDEIAARYASHTLVGLLLLGAALLASPSLALWMLPVVAGLTLAIPLALGSGNARIGRAMGRSGLMRIPEEQAPPPVLRRAARLRSEPSARAGVRQLFEDPRLFKAHVSMLPARRRRGEGAISIPLVVGRAKVEGADTLEDALRTLSPAELMASISDESTLAHLAVLARAAS